MTVNLCPWRGQEFESRIGTLGGGLSPHIADLGVLAGVKPWHSLLLGSRMWAQGSTRDSLISGHFCPPLLLVRTPSESRSQAMRSVEETGAEVWTQTIFLPCQMFLSQLCPESLSFHPIFINSYHLRPLSANCIPFAVHRSQDDFYQIWMSPVDTRLSPGDTELTKCVYAMITSAPWGIFWN